MSYQPFRLKRPLARDVSAHPDDLVAGKRSLAELGYYRGEPEPYVDDALFDAIAAFQQDNGLEVDGIIKQGGATESAIRQRLSERRPSYVQAEAASRLTDFASRAEVEATAFAANAKLAERLERGTIPNEATDWVRRALREGEASEALHAAQLVDQSRRLQERLGEGEQLLATELASRRRNDPEAPSQAILDEVRRGLRNAGGAAFAEVDDVNRPRAGDVKLFGQLASVTGVSIELGDGGHVRLVGPEGFAVTLPRAVVLALAADPHYARKQLAILMDWGAGRLASEAAIRERFTRRGSGVGGHSAFLDRERYEAFMEAEAARQAGADVHRLTAALAPLLFANAFDDAEARSSLLLDLLPVLGNLRSANEAGDAIVRLHSAVKAGDFSRIGPETLDAALAVVGALPGGSLPVGAIKRLLQPALREAPGLGKVLAQKRALRYMNFSRKLPPLPAEKVLGPLFHDLPPQAQRAVMGAFATSMEARQNVKPSKPSRRSASRSTKASEKGSSRAGAPNETRRIRRRWKSSSTGFG
jgi:hypothetical protein